MNTKTTPKDFFLHLGATVVLYVAVGAFIDLTFSVINYAFPDQLAGYFTATSMVWPMSLLIVLIPILYVLEWFINRDVTRTPEKKTLWIRSWRMYVTIFLGGTLIIGALISLLSTYLSGEISARFVWKVLAVLLVAGAGAKYYFFSLYEGFKWSKLIRRGNAGFGIILVIAAIVTGFIIVGSPTKQRAMRFDSQRISDLTNIQWQIVGYWQQKGKLPATLADVNDSISGQIVPSDPSTKAAYGYNIVKATSTKNAVFEICATFALASQDTKGRGAYGTGGGLGGVYYETTDVASSYPYPGIDGGTWEHPAGETCFARTIDPDRYAPAPAKEPAVSAKGM
jgi:uncharacterized membrane protein YjfL (UPF0719 family)